MVYETGNRTVDDAVERALDGERLDRTDGLALLAEPCSSDADWDRAAASAEYVVSLAYDDYADALRGMDVDPKPVC